MSVNTEILKAAQAHLNRTLAQPATEKQADEWTAVKSPINWSRILPKSDASAKNWQPSSQTQPAKPSPFSAPPMKPVNAPAMRPIKKSAAVAHVRLPAVPPALQFGEKLAQGFDLSSLQKYLPGAGLGAGTGALVGGLGGLLFPGRRRGRLSGALRGALAGAGLGGLAGGAASGGVFGQNAQDMTNAAAGGVQNAAGDIYKRLGALYKKTFDPPTESEALPEVKELQRKMKSDQALAASQSFQQAQSSRRIAQGADVARQVGAQRQNRARLNEPQSQADATAAMGEEYSGGDDPNAGKQTLQLNKDQNYRDWGKRYWPSAAGDRAMIEVLNRPPQGR